MLIQVGYLEPRFPLPPSPGLGAELLGSLSSPGCATDFHMLDSRIQQRMSPTSSFHP
uniref:Uncharacterized protein n=1 Tax=Cebus imitator TaxID=2715852 RepID=A0A2K5R376_CEBIM